MAMRSIAFCAAHSSSSLRCKEHKSIDLSLREVEGMNSLLMTDPFIGSGTDTQMSRIFTYATETHHTCKAATAGEH
jgi:hypothetical protein